MALLVAMVLALACRPKPDLRGAAVRSEARFRISDTVVCTTRIATRQTEVGSTFTIIDLASDRPRAIFAETGSAIPLVKVRSDAEGMTLVYVSPLAGGTEAIQLDVQTGKFARATTVNLDDVAAQAAVGTCR